LLSLIPNLRRDSLLGPQVPTEQVAVAPYAQSVHVIFKDTQVRHWPNVLLQVAHLGRITRKCVQRLVDAQKSVGMLGGLGVCVQDLNAVVNERNLKKLFEMPSG